MYNNVYINTGRDLDMKCIKVSRDHGMTRVTFAFRNGDEDTKLTDVSLNDAVDLYATVYEKTMTSVVETCA